MTWQDLKPRYWTGAYDAWHVALALILVGVVIGILALPAPPAPRSAPRGAAPRPATPSNAATGAAAAKPAKPAGAGNPTTRLPQNTARPVARTILNLPAPGSVLPAGRWVIASGTAEPGARVRLYWGAQMIGETRAGVDGRFQFQMGGFPMGLNRVYAVADFLGQFQASTETVFTVAPDPGNRPPGPARRGQ